MISIFVLSADDKAASSKKSRNVIVGVAEKVLNKKLTKKEEKLYTTKYVTIVRKGAHFTIYFILALLVISLLGEYGPLSKKSIIYAVSFVFLYAVTDEIHQMFVDGRSGELRDVFIDTMGGLLSSSIYYNIYKLRRKKNE